VIRTTLRILSVTLVLASFLALPATTAEPTTACAGSTPASLINASTPVPDVLAKLFGTIPAPQRKSGYVDCGESECPAGTNSASYRCMHYCLNYGLGCVDQCHEDPDTCELVLCICAAC
jgi:hypothetical protein